MSKQTVPVNFCGINTGLLTTYLLRLPYLIGTCCHVYRLKLELELKKALVYFFPHSTPLFLLTPIRNKKPLLLANLPWVKPSQDRME